MNHRGRSLTANGRGSEERMSKCFGECTVLESLVRMIRFGNITITSFQLVYSKDARPYGLDPMGQDSL